MTKEDDQDFENSSKCSICDVYVKGDDHFHITEKYRDSAHRDCNNNVKSDHKIPVTFDNLKKLGF